MTHTDIERRLREIAWPRPGEDLRRRVLSAAEVARTPVSWSDRMWYSRRWRAVAAATFVCAIALAAISGTDVTRLAPPATASGLSAAIDETGREIGLPEDLTLTLARRAVAIESAGARRRLSVALAATEGEGDPR